MAILLHRCGSQVYTPAQITRFNALHYKILRQIFQVKGSFYHRVLQPSDAECSKVFLLQLAYVHAPRLLIPSQRISVQRRRYLGKHSPPLWLPRTYKVIQYVPLFAYNFLSLSDRPPESALAGNSDVCLASLSSAPQWTFSLQPRSAPPSIRDCRNCNNSTRLWPFLDWMAKYHYHLQRVVARGFESLWLGSTCMPRKWESSLEHCWRVVLEACAMDCISLDKIRG